VKLTSDLINAKTGRVVAEAGTKMTPRLLRQLGEKGMEEQLVSDEDLIGRYIATDINNEQSGEIYAEAGDEIVPKKI
jgi:DNA-directed RNA polymerase subunit beta